MSKPTTTNMKPTVPTNSIPTVPPPIDTSPKGLAERSAAECGIRPGDEFVGVVAGTTANARLLRVEVPGWGEPVLCSCNADAGWRKGERIACRYVMSDGSGVLRFENQTGAQKNRRLRR